MLGHYQLLAVVGAGGMGRVWAARQVGALQRLVAIKTALCDSGQTKEFERVFIDEARIASLIHHPHVCGVYELGEEKGVLYLVMEWSDGGTLLEVVNAQPGTRLPAPLAASIVAKTCAGLHAAHELEDELGDPLNVVHRDVTPQNILMSSRGHVRLADFGVAKAQGQLHRPTETGEVKGKLSYMAPEQLTSKNLDRRVDIFALGCVLYECTVGRRPFQGDGALSTLYQILEEEVTSPSSLVPDYPPRLESIVLRALQKDPAERYQTAEEMQKELEGWIIETGTEIGEADFAQLVNAALGETIRTRNALIEESIERIDHPERARPDRATPAVEPARNDSSTPGVTAERGDRKPKASGWMLPALGGVATLAVVTLIAVQRMSGQAEPVTETRAVATSAPTGAVSPARAVDRVRVTVRTEPEAATIQLDDSPAIDAPFSAEVLQDGLTHTFVVSAPGFESKRQTIVFDTARDVLVRLQPSPAAAGSLAPAASGSPSGRKPRVTPSQGGNTKNSPAGEPISAAATPEPDKKGKRALDTTNPFGN